MQKIVDISHHNGVIDWAKVKESGNHVIIRCGYGQNLTKQDDKQWENNISGAEKYNVPYGVYFYSYASTEAAINGEIAHAIRLLKRCNGLSYPVFFDSEEEGTENVAKKNANAFCAAMENAGYMAGVYASQSWFIEHMPNINYVKWVARWGTKKPVIDWQLWQYTNNGTAPGIPNAGNELDLNWCKVDYPSLLGNNGKPVSSLTVDQLADAVINGAYGNGAKRKEALGDRYDIVQAIVNYRYNKRYDLTNVAKDTISGRYGNGEVRKVNLGSIYEPVQTLVNKLLK